MNKTYRSVWSQVDQTWVAAPETAKARGRSRRLAVVSGVAGIAASLMSGATFAATPAATVGNGSLELCSGVKGYSWGNTGGNNAMDCSVDGKGVTSDGLAFTLNNAGDKNGSYGFGASTARVAGYQNGTLTLKGASIMVYGPTTFDSVVTMSNQKIVQLAPGKISADSTEAVNGSQLYGIASEVSDALVYDSPAHDSVTLGGAAAMQPVALHNIAAGNVAPGSADAVNGGQLYDVSSTVTNVTNDLTKIHNTLTTAGWGAQAASSDPAAYSMGGFIMDENGKVSNPAVLYVPNTVGTADAHIVLDPGQGNSQYFVDGDRNKGNLPAGTVLSNVADGVQQTDAANVGQVAQMIALSSGGDAKVLRMMASAQSGAATGGSGVDLSEANAGVYKTAAYYSQVRGATNSIGTAGPTDVARANGAGSIAIGSNTEADGGGSSAVGIQSMASANDSVALGSGSVANKDNTVSVGSDGTAQRFVVNADGTTTTVQSQLNTRRIVNMAAGQDDTDAVNVGQLRSVASALGGGAGVNAAGAFIAPSYSVGGTVVNTVGDAIANLDNRVTQNTADIAALGGNAAAPAGASAQTSAPRMLAASRSVLAATDPASTTTDAGAVHYDSDAHDQITLASTSGGNVKLTGLQDGTLGVGSTDAVTGGQLYTTNQQVATINQMVQNLSTTGSTAVAVNSDSGPAAASGSSAIAVGGGAVATGNSATAIGDKANASAQNSVAIGANSIANRADAVSVGAEGSERQIVNVKAGTSGTDAVNLDQMNSAMTQQSNAFNNQVSALQSSINTVSKNAYAGVAAAMAMPSLTPSGPGRTVVAAGGGYYKGGSAAAVGVTYRSSNMHWLVNGAVSVTSTGDAGVRTQVGYEF